MKNCVLGVRVNEQQRQRLEGLAQEAGMSLSQMFRILVDNAELVSKPKVRTAIGIDNRDASISEAERATVAQ